MNKITTMTSPRPFVKREQPSPPLPVGNLFTRSLAVRVISQVKHIDEVEVANSLWPSDLALAALIATKASSAPAMTSVTGWAKELAAQRVADAVSTLGAASSAVEVMTRGLLLGWDGFGVINVPGFTASAAGASFVAEGDPIPVRQYSSSAKPLTPYKVAAIGVLSREMIESSNAEALIADVIVRSSGLAIDAQFFSANASSAAAPAGIRNGISASTPSANADPFGAFFEDMATLLNAVGVVGGKGPFFLVGNAGRVASASARYRDEASIIPIISSAMGGDVMAIAPQAIAAVVAATPDIETVSAGTLLMDTVPTGTFGATGPERSLFQTDSLAIKVRWPVSWALRSAAGVAWLTPAWK
jgi:hypothetical protein